jgi:Arc/MetJ-type ribon-helix-helix transcriptional regulator
VNINLPAEQREWLQAQIDAGRFKSLDEAVMAAVSDFMAAEHDDLSWARPYVDEARLAAARGEVVSVEEAVADLDDHLASLKR